MLRIVDCQLVIDVSGQTISTILIGTIIRTITNRYIFKDKDLI